MAPAGHCMYSAFSLGVFGTARYYKQLRLLAKRHIELNLETYRTAIVEDISEETVSFPFSYPTSLLLEPSSPVPMFCTHSSRPHSFITPPPFSLREAQILRSVACLTTPFVSSSTDGWTGLANRRGEMRQL